jgi:hypothetical protein
LIQPHGSSGEKSQLHQQSCHLVIVGVIACLQQLSDKMLVVCSMPSSRQRLNRALGYQPVKVGEGLQRAIAAIALSVPCAVIATAMSDSSVSNFFRYVLSPGTMPALRVARPESSHRGLGILIDVSNSVDRVMSFGLLANAIWYALLIFGSLTIISQLAKNTVEQ